MPLACWLRCVEDPRRASSCLRDVRMCGWNLMLLLDSKHTHTADGKERYDAILCSSASLHCVSNLRHFAFCESRFSRATVQPTSAHIHVFKRRWGSDLHWLGHVLCRDPKWIETLIFFRTPDPQLGLSCTRCQDTSESWKPRWFLVIVGWVKKNKSMEPFSRIML